MLYYTESGGIMEFHEISKRDNNNLFSMSSGQKPIILSVLKGILRRINNQLIGARSDSLMNPNNRAYDQQIDTLMKQKSMAEILIGFAEEELDDAEESRWRKEFREIGSQID